MFSFFRKRQKMVVIIMAVLMVSFLVGAQGFSAIAQKNPLKKVVGKTRLGELKRGDFQQASIDVQILLRYLGLGNPRRMIDAERIAPTDFEMLTLANDRSRIEAFAFLYHEARQAGYRTYDSEAEGFLKTIGLAKGSPQRKNLVALMRGRLTATDKDIVRAVARWLTINKSFASARVESPPSEQQVRHLFRNLVERIDLRVATVTADSMLEEVPEPSEEDIANQFEQAKNTFSGNFTEEDPFGFGYKLPDRVRISYLLVDRNVVERVTVADEQEVRDYYRRHTEKFVEPATTEPTTKPARQRKFSEVKQQIAADLKSEAVRKRTEGLLTLAEGLLEQYRAAPEPNTNAHQWVRDKMVSAANAILQSELDVVEIQAQPLDEAMTVLAKAAGLQAICYPYEAYGASKLDPSVEVTIRGRGITLAEALAQVDRQVKSPPLKWVEFGGFEGVIFADGESGLQPVIVGQSDLIARDRPISDEILRNCLTASGQPLSEIAFMLEAFAEDGVKQSVIKVNEDGPRMSATGDRPGVVLWRVTEALAAKAPQALTDQLRQQVVSDLKIKQAFNLASKRAANLAEAAGDIGLEEAAEQAGIETTTTGLFSRKTVAFPRQIAFYQMSLGQIDQAEAVAGMMMLPPQVVRWTEVPGIELPDEKERRELIKKAFALIPAQIEPAEGDVPYPQQPYAVASLTSPARREAAVIQRVDYRPAVSSKYEDEGRKQLTRSLVEVADWEGRVSWFSADQAAKRLNFEPVRP